ncbi:MAG: multiple sugar transport system permease protein [Halanaerobiales bacterium]|nr:multiple sugar transport system permease protein [Halanaerobiales bacterium]
MNKQWRNYLLLLPVALFVIIVFAYPIIKTFQYSFYEVPFGLDKGEFIGLSNFKKVFSDGEFWVRLKNTIFWTLYNLILQLVLPLLVAFILLKRTWLNKLTQSLILLPWIVPAVAIAVVFRLFLLPGLGYANTLISTLGFNQIDFLGNSSLAMITLVFINTWKFVPFGTLVVLAALQSIPQENYEAAQIDGAGAWQRFTKITLPLMAQKIWFLPFLSIVWNFNVFDLIWLTTQGGPGLSTETLPIGIFRYAFRTFQFGKAAATATVAILGLAIIGILYFKFAIPEKEGVN